MPPGHFICCRHRLFLLTRKRPPHIAAPRPNSPVRGVLSVATLLGASRSGGGSEAETRGFRPPRKKTRVTRRYRRRRGLGVPLPLLFPWLVEPGSRQPVSLPFPSSASQAPPPRTRRIRSTRFMTTGGGATGLLLYHSRHRKGKTKTSRVACLAFSLRLWSQANTPRAKFPLDIRDRPWYIVGVWSHRTPNNGTPSRLPGVFAFWLPSDDATVGRFFVCTYSPHRRQAPPLRR